jgi:hypothetical protein
VDLNQIVHHPAGSKELVVLKVNHMTCTPAWRAWDTMHVSEEAPD